MIKINYSSLLLFAIFVGFVAYSDCQQPDLCRKKNRANGGLFEHEEYCDYYWRCDSRKSEPYLQACPNGLAFAGKGRGLFEFCGYPHLLKTCDGDVRYQAQEPVASENCPYSYGIFPHKTSCAKYWQCWNGTASEQKCGFQLLYNEEISSCDYPSNVKGCQKHPICKEVPNGPVLLKGSCILYWQCVGGYPRLERCPAGLAVNPRTLKCELATTVPECAPKVTTPKPEDPDDENDEKDEKDEKNEKTERNEKKKNESPARPLNAVAKAAKVPKESKDQTDPKDPKIIIIIKKPAPKPKLGAKPKVAKAQREIGASSSAPKHQKEVRKEAKKEVKKEAKKEPRNTKETKKEEAKVTSPVKPAGKAKASNPAKSSKASGQVKASNQAKPSNQTSPASEAKEKKKKKKQKQGLRSQ